MPRSYPYGKVPSSIATVISERFERPMVCCGYCSGQNVCRSAKAGISTDGRKEGHLMRAAGGRPHWAGNTANELRAGAQKALGVTLLGIRRDDVLERVKAGYAVACSLVYVELPSYLKVQLNDFGHSVMVKGYRSANGVDYVGFFDPLWEQSSQGSWARWDDIAHTLWDTGHSTNTTKFVPTTRYTIHIAKGATVRAYSLRKPTSGAGPWCIQKNADGSYGHDTVWNRRASKADCTAPISRLTCDGHSSATTVLVTSGVFKDDNVRIGSQYGVTVTPKEV